MKPYLENRIGEIIQQEAKAILGIPRGSQFREALDLIHLQVHVNGGKIVCSGMGKAGQIAIKVATSFSSTGTPSVFLHPADAQHGDLGLVQANDVLIIFSNSGKTREALELTSLARNMNPGTKVILITGQSDSPLASMSDIVLGTGNPEEVCPLKMVPTTSTTTMMVIGDILVVTMMEKIGFTVEEYAKRHHGGYLGVKSKESIEKSSQTHKNEQNI